MQTKLTDFLSQGTQIGILIYPEERWVEIYRLGQVAVRLSGDSVLTLPDLFPGWALNLSEIWSPKF